MSEPRRIVISGCSGGGKSTLLAALAARGYQTFEEPGRRVVREGINPAEDVLGFAARAATLAAEDFDAAVSSGFSFFDRSVVDAVAALQRSRIALPDALQTLAARCRYDSPIFLTPPWPEIYQTDAERQHSLEDAVMEYDDLRRAYPAQGYETIILPKASVAARTEFVLRTLDA